MKRYLQIFGTKSDATLAEARAELAKFGVTCTYVSYRPNLIEITTDSLRDSDFVTLKLQSNVRVVKRKR